MKRRDFMEKALAASGIAAVGGCLDSVSGQSEEECGNYHWIGEGESITYTQDGKTYSTEVEEITGSDTAELSMTAEEGMEFPVTVESGNYYKVGDELEYEAKVDSTRDRVRLGFMEEVCKE